MGKKDQHFAGRKILPIGNDDFRKLRENDAYYVDKTRMIKDFKFFDITKDSRDIFKGLAIMDTEYAEQINSRPVIYFTFKDCKGATVDELLYLVKRNLYQEYLKYEKILRNKLDKDSFETWLSRSVRPVFLQSVWKRHEREPCIGAGSSYRSSAGCKRERLFTV